MWKQKSQEEQSCKQVILLDILYYMIYNSITMLISTITQKGQATIPLQIRNSLGLTYGSKIQFVDTNNGVKLKAIPSLASFKGSLKGQKLPSEKDLEMLFAQEAVSRDK